MWLDCLKVINLLSCLIRILKIYFAGLISLIMYLGFDNFFICPIVNLFLKKTNKLLTYRAIITRIIM